MNQAPATARDDDMPAEIDFSKGQRGKFHRPGTRLALPVYLDEQVQATLSALASAKGVDLSIWSTICCARTSSCSRWGIEPRDRATRLLIRPIASAMDLPNAFSKASAAMHRRSHVAPRASIHAGWQAAR